jgi:competence protein ComEC
LQAISQSALQNFIGEDVEISGVVNSDSRATKERVIGSRFIPSQTTFGLRVERVAQEQMSNSMRIPIRVMVSESIQLVPGDRITISGRLRASHELRYAAVLQTDSLQDVSKKSNPVSVRLENIRASIRALAFGLGSESAVLLPGMGLGDTSLQSPSFASIMRSAGLSHLTAVSGANFAIVSAFVFLFVSLITSNLKAQVAVTALFLALFIFLVRPTPSVLRAAVMAGVFLLARISGNRRSSLNALAAAIAILLLINPFQAFDPGFILSVSATSGLIILSPKLREVLDKRLPTWLAEILAISISATAFCAPYLLYLTGSINSLTIIANALVAPVVPLITVLTLISTLTVSFSEPVAEFFLRLADYGANWIYLVATFADRGPSLNYQIVFMGALLGAVIWKFLNFRIAGGIILVLLMISLWNRANFPGDKWLIGQCDVGQGDALLINLGDGNAALFDAGPDSEKLLDCLKIFGINYLPLVTISHRHADHYQGLFRIGDRLIGQIWVNQSNFLDLEFSEVSVKKAGDRAQVGNLKLEVLWPINDGFEGAKLLGDGSAENNRSLVILAELNGTKILITGDIEPDAQREIAQRYRLEEIEVLKVAHHGSRYQDASFLEEVRARINLVSVGANSYGHPDPDLMAVLGAGSGEVFRTDKGGAISLTWNAPKDSNRPIFSPREIGKDWWQIKWI